jgi:transcriptional regulator with XRE-family HTH domain
MAKRRNNRECPLLLMSCAAMIRALRAAHGWSQAELSARTGMNERVIRFLESGGHPTTNQIDRIAAALQVPSRVLTGDLPVAMQSHKEPASPVPAGSLAI